MWRVIGLRESKEVQERKKLRELIRMYKREGYEICADYLGYEKPRVIAGIVPDLIVRKGDREIIVEIVSDKSLPHLVNKLKLLSDYAAQHRGKSFDLVVTNPKARRSYISIEDRKLFYEYLLEDLEGKLFLEVKKLYERGYFEASFRVLFRLLGSFLRKIAYEKRVVQLKRKMSTREVNSMLFENNILTKDDFVFIKKMIDYRNEVIHHRKLIQKRRLENYIDFVSTLLKSAK